MGGVATGLGAIWVVTAVGYLVGRTGLLGEPGGAVLARVAFYVAMPALLFATLARSDLDEVFTPALAAFAAGAVVTAAAYLAVARLVLKRDTPEAIIGTLGASYVNSGNLGLPVAAYVLGDVSLMIPVMLFNVIVAAPLALAVLDRSATATRGSPLCNPILLGSVAGVVVAVTGWHPPDALLAPFELVGAAAVPLALLALGLALPGARPFAPGPQAVDRYVASTLKIVGQPVVTWAIGRAAGLDGTSLLTAVVAAALPTAQNVFVFASRHDRATPLARDVIVLTTLAAAVSLFVVVATVRPPG